jgi:Homeodomain-like domain
VRGHQRYRCKGCGCNFTATPERGKPAAMKARAVLLYAMGNASQGMIARLLGVSHVTICQWLRAAGEDTPAPSAAPSSGIVQVDEMWHFVQGKKQGLAVAGLRSWGTANPGLGAGWA